MHRLMQNRGFAHHFQKKNDQKFVVVKQSNLDKGIKMHRLGCSNIRPLRIIWHLGRTFREVVVLFQENWIYSEDPFGAFLDDFGSK